VLYYDAPNGNAIYYAYSSLAHAKGNDESTIHESWQLEALVVYAS